MIATFTVPAPPMRGRIVAVAIAPPAPPTEMLDELPDGVWERDGQLFYVCVSCDNDFPLECDLEDFVPEYAYCGGSPRCLP